VFEKHHVQINFRGCSGVVKIVVLPKYDFFFKPKSRFALQVIGNDVNRAMTRKNIYIYLLGKLGN